jgi:hypothetical protein
MKIVALMLLMTLCYGTAVAAPVPPIFSWSDSIVGNNQFFSSSPITANWAFPNRNINYLTASATVSKGVRFHVGYIFGHNDATGNENNRLTAGVEKQVSDKWWITAGYQGGVYPFGIINLGAIYNISPNAALSVGYSIQDNYELKNSLFRTQLYIKF